MDKHNTADLAGGSNGAMARQIVAEKAKRGMSIAEFEERSGLNWRTLARKVQSYERPLNLGEVDACARAFNLDLRTLLERALTESVDE